MAELTADDVHLALVGETVDLIWIDFRLTLAFSNRSMVSFETTFAIRDTDGVTVSVDPEDKDSLLPALHLHTQNVTGARIDESALEITFSSGTTLRAEPDDDYESWHYSGPETPPVRATALGGGNLFISIPGDGTPIEHG
ncbi:DUF6188 family protein [Curtobacterium aurantiacum]|uniref:Uncharacterized protein n=1 Tax=Curtobacterium aurantiacum TaxID=3236919 RepID=A0ABS5VFI1_9MICO|nr:DUF6188 family protein [Curtobacterium flaccumfaciens]MBT1545413.1 hypothetical protein [Curtobacterium flaccumfaciens pv. flaccumfaciens]MBT1588229.1 hypothetical protein [Curtobacterium flaccumfaciens pv. flaccumfaciens]MBT1680180.1 hypothetical protein [Curtobacterium flaccumfaciens pv. flaccumfaciens]